MKNDMVDIPEVSLSDVKEFWVLGSQYKDGILGEYNLKMDIKKALKNDGSEEGGSEEDVFLDLSTFDYPAAGLPELISSLAEEAYNRAQALNLQIGDTVVVKEPSGESTYTVEHIPEEEDNGYALQYGDYIILFGYDDSEGAYNGVWRNTNQGNMF